MTLVLRSLTDPLALGARILDVEASSYTRAWFDRFNQFDYRSLSTTSADAEIRGDVTTVRIPKGMCQLIVFGRGVGPGLDPSEVAQAAHRLVASDGAVVVSSSSPPSRPAGLAADELRRTFEEHGFAVALNDLAQRLPPGQAHHFGVTGSTPILVCVPRSAS